MADSKISALPVSTVPLVGAEVLPIVQSGSTKKVSVANLTAGRTVDTGNLNVSGEQTIIGAVRGVLKLYGDFAGGTDVGKIQFFNAADEFLAQVNINNTTGAAGDTSNMEMWVSAAGVAKKVITFESNQNATLEAGNLVIGTSGKGIDFSSDSHAAGMTSELLDDYEEGTFTATLTGATPPSTPVTATAYYTKVGNLVTAFISFRNVDTTGVAGAASVTGLPFTSSSAYYATGAMWAGRLLATSPVANISPSSTTVTVVEGGTSNGVSWLTAGAGTYWGITISYFV